MEIAPGIHLVKVLIPNNPLGHLNTYLVEGKTGWVMIDTGWYTPEAFDSLQKGLADIGLVFSDIETIILTHIHPDHFGLAGRIKHVSPATKLLMHQLEADCIEPRYIKFSDLQKKMGKFLLRHGVPPMDRAILEASSLPLLEFVRITFPDQKLFGGEVISSGVYDLEIIWTPGHSIGHICIYEPQNQILFAGDHVLPTISPNVSSHVQSGDNPLGDYLHNLKKLEALPVKKVLPAHEHVFDDLGKRINEIRLHHDTRKTEILKAMNSGHRSAFDISSQISWKGPDSGWEHLGAFQKRIAVAETIAHLECMRWEGDVNKIVQDDIVTYDCRR